MFLEERANQYIPKTYMDDEKALEKLNLIYNRHLFGRMSEAYVLLALLDNFKGNFDSIAVYPSKDEILYFGQWAPKYGALYLWNKRK